MLVGWTMVMIALGIRRASFFEGYLDNGAFQLLNALRRIAAGQRVGVDFQLFHGAGIPYLHYPVYAAFGKTLFSAEIARFSVTVICHLAALLAMCAAYTRSARWGVLLATVALVAGAGTLTLYTPQASIFGVRALAPALVVSVLFLGGSSARRVVLGAAAVGLALLLGIDQGMAAVAGLVLGSGIAALLLPSGRRLSVMAEGAAMALIGIAVFTTLVLVITSPAGFRPAMRYWFREVPGDQFWFFGIPPWGVVRWGQLFGIWRMWLQLAAVALEVFWASRLLRGRTGEPADAQRLVGISVGAVYSAFSYAALLAMPDTKYLDAGMRIVLVLLICLAWRSSLRDARWRALVVSRRAVLASGAVTLLALGGVAWVAARFLLARPVETLRITPRALVAGARHPRLREDYALDVALGRAYLQSRSAELGRPVIVWPQYSGLLSNFTGAIPPSFDYVIHALGPTSWASYLGTFDRTPPDVVQLLRRAYYHSTYHTLFLEHWAFYDRVLRRYAPEYVSPTSVFWVPRRTPLITGPVVEVPIGPADPTNVSLPLEPALDLARRVSGARPLYVVTLDYEIRNPYRPLPIIGQLPRYMVSVDGTLLSEPMVSLTPYRTRMSFPILVDTARPPGLRIGVQSLLGGASLRPTRIRVEPVALVGSDTLLFRN